MHRAGKLLGQHPWQVDRQRDGGRLLVVVHQCQRQPRMRQNASPAAPDTSTASSPDRVSPSSSTTSPSTTPPVGTRPTMEFALATVAVRTGQGALLPTVGRRCTSPSTPRTPRLSMSPTTHSSARPPSRRCPKGGPGSLRLLGARRPGVLVSVGTGCLCGAGPSCRPGGAVDRAGLNRYSIQSSSGQLYALG